MCIMMTPHEPSSTHLFNIPYTIDGVKYQLLLYTNDLSFEDKSKGKEITRSMDADPLKTYYSTMIERGYLDERSFGVPAGAEKTIATAPDTALMIVPIPNPTNATNFGLVDVTTKQMKQFRTEAKRVGNGLIPWEYLLSSTNMDGVLFGKSESLMVHRIGNYDISVAPSLEALEEQIDWSHFSLPADFERRKATLSNSTLFPYSCAYVVAKAVTSVKDDGFGVLFPDPGFTYFPTCHEDNGGKHNYDVRCYEFGSKRHNSFPFKVTCDAISKYNYSFSASEGSKVAAVGKVFNGQSRYATSFSGINVETVRGMLSLLPTSCIMSERGKEESIKCNKEKAEVFNFCPINTKAVNQNIVLVK